MRQPAPIVARIKGGLGNQLFQLAAALDVCQRSGRGWGGLMVDTSEIDEDRLREPLYGHFDLPIEPLPAPIARRLWAATPPPVGLRRDLLDLLRHRFPRPLLLRESGSGFSPLDSVPRWRPAVLDGYWQDERYFSTVAHTIGSVFRRSELFLESSLAAAACIAASEFPVAVHVRRGDYVNNPEITRVHGVLNVEYYRRACERLAQVLPGRPHLLVFSDDPEAATVILDSLPFEGIVADRKSDPQDEATLEDLELQARCRHHITANSSFSWWGAWLATWDGQAVVAPARWYAGSTPAAPHPAPDRWILI